MNEGFNLVYARIGRIPKNIYFENRRDVILFLADNLNEIDFLSINDVNININELVNKNLKLSRYLKLMKVYDI